MVFGYRLSCDHAADKNEVFVIGECKFRTFNQRILAGPRRADDEDELSTARYFLPGETDISAKKLGIEPVIEAMALVRESALGRYTEVGARTKVVETTTGDFS